MEMFYNGFCLDVSFRCASRNELPQSLCVCVVVVIRESGNKPIASRRVPSQAVNYQLILLIVVSDRLNDYKKKKLYFFVSQSPVRLAQVRRCQTSRLMLLSRRRNFYVSHRWRPTPPFETQQSMLDVALLGSSTKVSHFTRWHSSGGRNAKTKKKTKNQFYMSHYVTFHFCAFVAVIMQLNSEKMIGRHESVIVCVFQHFQFITIWHARAAIEFNLSGRSKFHCRTAKRQATDN